MRSLSEMFNVNYFLVSQTNPHIVPALNLKKRFNRKLGNIIETEWKHRCPPGCHWPTFSALCSVTLPCPPCFMNSSAVSPGLLGALRQCVHSGQAATTAGTRPS